MPAAHTQQKLPQVTPPPPPLGMMRPRNRRVPLASLCYSYKSSFRSMKNECCDKFRVSFLFLLHIIRRYCGSKVLYLGREKLF